MATALKPPDVVGVTEFARMAGVAKQTVSSWVDRDVTPTLPPSTVLVSGRVWRREHVVAWIEAAGKAGRL